MRTRDILAANMVALMTEVPAAGSLKLLRGKSGVSNGTLDRIRRAEVGASVDQLEPLAEAFGVEPWELLVQPEHRLAMRTLAQALKAATRAPAAAPAEGHTDSESKQQAERLAVIDDRIATSKGTGTRSTAPAAAPANGPAVKRTKRQPQRTR